MLLTGTFTRSIDEKLRIAIPKRLRDAMQSPSDEGVYVAPGTDRSLAIYTEEAFGRLAERLERVSPTQHQVRDFTRLFYARAQHVDFDSQGRIRIPPELAELAGLGSEAVLVGVRDHLELWDRARWESYLAERQSRFDEIAEAAFDNPSAEPAKDRQAAGNTEEK
jgi:MraZ protein